MSKPPPETLGDQIRNHYPRLIRCLKIQCDLHEPEAVRALVEYQVFGMIEGFGDGLVTVVFGGPLAAIRHAIRHRHISPMQPPRTSR